MWKINRHEEFSIIFTKRVISDLFYHIASQIDMESDKNAYNILFDKKSHLIFTNEKIKRDYDSGNLRKIKAIFSNFVKRLVLCGLNSFVATIDMAILLGIFDNDTTIYDIDGYDNEKLKVSNIYEMKKIIKHLMCCEKNLNLLNDIIHNNFDMICNMDKMKIFRPEMITIFNNLSKCSRCHAFSYSEGEERAAAIIQRSYLHYRDTPVELSNANVEKSLWWKIHTKRLGDLCNEYEIILN